MKQETRKTYTYTTHPSTKRLAMKRAKKEGKKLSSIIDMALKGYVAAEVWKDMEGNPQTPNSIILDEAPLKIKK